MLTKEQTEDGIKISFTPPEDATFYKVYIDNLEIYEDFSLRTSDKGNVFLYPLVQNQKDYTFRFEFGYPKQNSSDFCLGVVVLAWDEITVKANGGLGELSATNFEISDVNAEGAYTITKKPIFSNSTVLPENRCMVMYLSAGVAPNSEEYKTIGCKGLGNEKLDIDVTSSNANNCAKYQIYDSCFLEYYPACIWTDSDDKEWEYRLSEGKIKKLTEGVGSDVSDNATVEVKDTNEGVLVEFKAPPETKSYEFSIDDKYCYYMSVYDDEKTEESVTGLFLYPFVENKKDYVLTLIFKDSSNNKIGFIKKKVTATGGLGSFTEVTPHKYTVDKENCSVTITQGAVISNPTLVATLNRIDGCEFKEKMAFYGKDWDWQGTTFIDIGVVKTVDVYEYVELGKIIDIVQLMFQPKYKSENLDRTWEYGITCTNNHIPGLNMEIKRPASKGATLIAKKSRPGIFVELEVPESVDHYSFCIGDYRIPYAEIGKYELTDGGKLFSSWYPFVEDGKKYNVVYNFYKGSELIAWCEKTVTASGGIGKIYDLPELEYNSNDRTIKVTKNPCTDTQKVAKFMEDNPGLRFGLTAVVYCGNNKVNWVAHYEGFDKNSEEDLNKLIDVVSDFDWWEDRVYYPFYVEYIKYYAKFWFDEGQYDLADHEILKSFVPFTVNKEDFYGEEVNEESEEASNE